MIAKLNLEKLKALVDELLSQGVEYVNTYEDVRNNKLKLSPIVPKEESKENKEITAA